MNLKRILLSFAAEIVGLKEKMDILEEENEKLRKCVKDLLIFKKELTHFLDQ